MSEPNVQDTNEPSDPRLRLAAVGDLLLATTPDDPAAGRDLDAMFEGVRAALAGCDVVLANLECTLPGGAVVSTEPRVIASEELIRAAAAAGVGVVSLAHNHAFDCGVEGFENLRPLLDELGVAHFGAGRDLDEATAPAIVEADGVSLAILGGADASTGAYHFAGPGQPGVAPLDVEGLRERIADLHSRVDHVIVAAHWGEERFAVPSPRQIAQARSLVEAGASAVLGHHPHVLQGMETYRGRPIAYSLGNFVANEVPLSDGDAIRWGRPGRTGCVLRMDLRPGGVDDIEQIATHDDGLRIEVDRSRWARRRLAKLNRAVAGGVSPRRYRREHVRVHVVRPFLGYLRWSRLTRVRPRHVSKALREVLHSRKRNV